MLKEHDTPKEKARHRAERKWKNAEVRKKIKEEQKRPKLVDPDAPPRGAELIENDGRKDGRVNRFENKFKKRYKGHDGRPKRTKFADICRND